MTAPRPARRLVSSTAAGEALGVHPGTLWRWHHDPTHPVKADAITPGRHLRWDLDRLRALVDELTRPTRSEDDVTQPASRPEDQPVVAAIVTSHRGVLAGKRHDGRPPWTFIAGEVEPGESIADAAVREVKEETGLLVRAAHQELGRRIHPKTKRLMIYLACQPVESTEVFVGDAEELAAVEWLGLAAVDDLMPGLFEPVREHLGRVIS